MSEIFKCTCGCGGVEVSQWRDEEEVICIEFLKRCRSGRSIKKRLKMIWGLLRRGYYYDDDIVLDKTTSGALGSTLVEMSNQIKE